MKFDRIFVMKAEPKDLDHLEKHFINKFTPKFNFENNPLMNNERYKCFSIINCKYPSMAALSNEVGICKSQLSVIMNPDNTLNDYQKSIFDRVRNHLFSKYQKIRKI